VSDVDTIAAIATASGPAGVGIVRLSGPEAFAVADRVLIAARPLGRCAGHTLHRARVRDPRSGEVIDDGLVAVFHRPRSLTGEDVAEIQGHGGAVTLSRVLHAVLAAGARAARPGEFSERAFLNNKMDLAQAEAVAALVSAQTVAAQRAARRQVEGGLSRSVRAAAGEIEEALARLEASIDFPEEVGEPDPEILDACLARAENGVAGLLATADYGRRLFTGITVVLAGRPNVGKSSLLNALAGSERAIVTPIPGTTRDVIEERIGLNGLPVRALDTAGLRETEDPVERIGVERARSAVRDADVIVAVLDAAAGLTGEDEDFLRSLDGRKLVVAVNKADIADPEPTVAAARRCTDAPVVATTATTGENVLALAGAIADRAAGGGDVAEEAILVTSARHEAALREAATGLAAARDTLRQGLPPELVAVDAHGALRSLGEITGETAREEIIAGIFARFCIGK
jgi:tRNA modification GTPase